MIIMQVARVTGNLVRPGHPHKCTSDVTRLFFSSPPFFIYLIPFKACFQYVGCSFEEYVFCLEVSARARLSLSAWEKKSH